HLFVLVLDDNRRPQILLVTPRADAPVDDRTLADARLLVERLRHRLTLNQILETDAAFDFGEDRARVGFPLGDALATLDLAAVIDQEPGAVGNAMGRALAAVGIEHRNDHVADHRDVLSLGVLHHALVLDLDPAFEVRLNEGLLRNLRRPADVESPHREL